MSEEGKCCGVTDSSGINYATPKDAINGPQEKVLFMTCPNYDIPLPDLTMNLPVNMQPKQPDSIFTVDVDPKSSTYCQVAFKFLDFLCNELFI
jgi:hypothetical protein